MGLHVTDAMAKDKQVLIRVDETTKKEWEKAADERGFRGMSGFIRFAVNNEIEGRNTEAEITADNPFGDILGDESLEDTVDRVDSKMGTMNRRLSAIEAAIETIQDDLDTEGEGTVAAELIFEGLPNTSPYKKNDSGRPVDKSRDELAEQAKSPEDVAGDIGVPPSPVKRTLERLAIESERVKSVELDNGERRYFADV